MADHNVVPYGSEYFATYEGDEKRKTWYQSEHRRIVEMRPEGGRILDVGCGTGRFLQQFDERWQKYGVDVSDFAIERSRAAGISVKDYDVAYDYPDETFDVIVFRGTIQHLEAPFAVLKKCTALLLKGGLMAFLSTPNSNSVCYKLFGDMPMLAPELNFYIPSSTTLRQVLTNFGLNVVRVRFPYLETPYARPVRDHLFFALRCFGVRLDFAFWRNMMEIYAEKSGAADG